LPGLFIGRYLKYQSRFECAYNYSDNVLVNPFPFLEIYTSSYIKAQFRVVG